MVEFGSLLKKREWLHENCEVMNLCGKLNEEVRRKSGQRGEGLASPTLRDGQKRRKRQYKRGGA